MRNLTWIVGDAQPESALLEFPDGPDKVRLERLSGLSDEEWQGVINLIHAAPDLLAALKHIVQDVQACLDGIQSPESITGVLVEARAAIAKAEQG